jgi:peptide/nickel transport system substrate-binding protein
VTRWTQRNLLAAALAALPFAEAPALQGAAPNPSIVIVTGQDAPMPIPTLMEGVQSSLANFEVADHLFLRLAALGPSLTTVGDGGFLPLLARSWHRRDSLTLAFELDPRARWHDGAPVTSRDVVFTFARARDPSIAPKLATALKHVAAVAAEGERTVVFRFSRAYGEQLYDATHHVAPLPAHLLAGLPANGIARSRFVAHPIGNGPYRWVRSLPGQFIELAANEQFFLGRPAIRRLVVRVAKDADARLNLVLSGEADAMDNILPPPANLTRVAARPELRLVPVPSSIVGYLLYNQRDPRDRTRPHPILADLDVRRALTLALDRRLMVQAVFGPYGEVPYGPVSSLLWIRHGAPQPAPHDRGAAGRLLESRGWVDRDGDGIRERDGQPLALRLHVTNTSAIRRQMSLLIQRQLGDVGVRIDLVQLDGPTWLERRTAGDFDIDFSASVQDPSPSTLVQSWSCNGSSNVGRFCDPVVDSLLDRAILTRDDARNAWHDVLRRIEDGAPAAFLYAPIYVYVVNRRFRDVAIRPESSWISLWRWNLAGAPAARPAGS